MPQPDNLNLFICCSLCLLANLIGFEIINISGLSLFPFCNFKMTTKVLLLPILVSRLLQFMQFIFDSLGVSRSQIQVISKGLE